MTEALPDNGARAPLPPKVAEAITAVMSEVPKLVKTEKNTHGKYNFASIDDFLEAVRPLCAKNKLIILQDEESFHTIETESSWASNDAVSGKMTKWLVMKFSFTLSVGDETWGHRPIRTAMVQAKMGAQALGAAQSYALKQFMRSLFQIATGEKGQDADEHPQDDLPEKKRRKAESSGVTTLKKDMHAFSNDLAACEDEGSVIGLLNASQSLFQQCEGALPRWMEAANEAIAKRRGVLEERAALQPPQEPPPSENEVNPLG